ncbi:MAG: hypothetical protein ACNYPE_00755 [Candidatus Azotimanducaceae bacterium WSBS_2022_MAG_OTU7]
MTKPFYTTQLQAGLGLVDETKLLLSLYQKDLSVNQLYEKSLNSGLFPMVSARRLRNIVLECFAPRYIKTNASSILALYDTMKGRIVEATHSQYAIHAQDWIFERPIFKSTDFVGHAGVSEATAKRLLNELAAHDAAQGCR